MKYVNKERMIKIMIEHGMSATDFLDFYEEFGTTGDYKVSDIRRFLGY